MRVVLTQVVEPSAPEGAVQWPLGLGYLASYAGTHMDGAEFVYAEGEDVILRENPDIVGVSSTTVVFDRAAGLCERLRKGFDGPILVGGAHISAMPYSLPPGADAGVIGEGERTFVRLLELIRQRGDDWRSGLYGIEGICFHGPEGVVVTATCDPIADVDSIPFPDRSMLRKGWPRTAEYPGSYSMFSARGCPYDCRFCFSTRFWKKLRRHSAEYVVEEVTKLREDDDAVSITFLDDLFISDKKRLSDIATLVSGTGLADEIDFACTISSNEVDEGACESMARMNIGLVITGLESASDDVLRLMRKRTTVEKHERALALLSDHGIKVVASFLLGFPGETVRDMEMTAQFIDRHLGSDLEETEVYPAVPYPGTFLWDLAVERGLLRGDETGGRALFSVAEATFDPDTYLLLNDRVPRETFLRYYYQLKCGSYRREAARKSRVIKELQGRLDPRNGPAASGRTTSGGDMEPGPPA